MTDILDKHRPLLRFCSTLVRVDIIASVTITVALSLYLRGH